ncbi:MAG: hypothetical protein IJU23_00545, partial [Proteobacteria bacterium]|nr:hypothetical protein [Pseudomonadota bacterium]
NKCEKSSGSSVVGVLTRCINNMWDEDSETCEADGGKYVSCQSDTQCGVCKNNEIRCKDKNTEQVCKNGKWFDNKCDANQICDTTSNNKCVDNTNTCETPGEKRCKPGDKDTPQTIIEECKESKGKRYWETIKTCSDNTPVCIPYDYPGSGPKCVQCDVTAVLGSEYNGYRCDPNNDRKRQSCQVYQWKEFQLVDQDCSSSEVCEEKSTVARNDKGEYFTIYDARCVKRN